MLLTTDSVSTRERAEFWTDLISRNVTPIAIEPGASRPLRGEIRARAVGGLVIAQVSGQGVRASHTRAHIARARSHVYSACVHIAGHALISRGSEMIALEPGDVFITDSRALFTLDLDRPWRHLDLTLPTGWLDGRLVHARPLAGVVLRDRPLARLWASHLAAGFALAEELSPDAATLFARHSVELLAQLLDESRTGDAAMTEASGAATFMSACRVIATRCTDPLLTPATIAREIGVSSRTLARAFAARNETVMRRVFDERIARAARLLASPEYDRRSITDIALACGFNDPSHFGRVFFRKMQMTPSQWRRRTR
ncbi:MAG TPA: helix-turn-helix domain-containing protein [Gammaproteobacteria bacterium]